MSTNNPDNYDKERDLLNDLFQEGVDEEGDTSDEPIDDFFDELINGSNEKDSEVSETVTIRSDEIDYILGLEGENNNGNELERNIDSIDEVGPKHTYTLEEAKDYLEKLNEKYPIGKITKDLEDIFNMSFALNSNIEWEFEKILKASIKAGKWVSIDYSKGYTLEMINEGINNKGVSNSLEYDGIGFYNGAPDENEITYLKYKGSKRKAQDFLNSLSEEEEIKALGNRSELTKIVSDFSEDEIKKMDDMPENERAIYIIDFIKEKYPDTYSEMLPVPGYFNQLVEEKLTSEEKLEIFGDEEKLKEFLDSLDEKEADRLKFESIVSIESFGKPKLQMMPKENLIKFIIGRLGFEIVGKKDPIEEILNKGIDKEVTLYQGVTNTLSYKYFIEISTEGVNTGLSPYDVEDMINCFTKFNLSSREEIIHHIESENKRILKEDTYTEENLEKRLNTQITILENMIKNGHIIEGKNGKLNLNIRFKEEPVNKLYGI